MGVGPAIYGVAAN